MTHPLSYSEMVAKLAKPGADIIAQMTAHQANLLHMAVGMAGESAEIETAFKKIWNDVFEPSLQGISGLKRDAINELGDFEFYFEGILQGLSESSDAVAKAAAMPAHRIPYPTVAIDALGHEARVVLGQVKKHAICGDPLLISTVRPSLIAIASALATIAASLGVTRHEARARNMDKLAKRYPGFEYSNQAASARADKEAE